MKISSRFIGLFVGLVVATIGCTSQDANPCTFPHQLTVSSGCYAGNGLLFTASDYGSKPLSFEWTIIALKDSATVLGWTPKDEKIRMIASDKFTVPDSLVSKYQRLIVKVASNCNGPLLHSSYQGFIKKKSSNCISWIAQAN